jgi:hypothetical protein
VHLFGFIIRSKRRKVTLTLKVHRYIYRALRSKKLSLVATKLAAKPVTEFSKHRTLVARTKLAQFHPINCKQTGMKAVLTHKAFQMRYKIKIQR